MNRKALFVCLKSGRILIATTFFLITSMQYGHVLSYSLHSIVCHVHFVKMEDPVLLEADLLICLRMNDLLDWKYQCVQVLISH